MPVEAEKRKCEQIAVAAGPIARVERCACCGVVTMHLGAVSVRLDTDALGAVAQTLGEAVRRIEREGATVLPFSFGGRGSALT